MSWRRELQKKWVAEMAPRPISNDVIENKEAYYQKKRERLNDLITLRQNRSKDLTEALQGQWAEKAKSAIADHDQALTAGRATVSQQLDEYNLPN